MKKKLTVLLIAVMSVFLIAGCSNAEKDAAKDVADQFMAAMVEGDFKTAMSFCNEEDMSSFDFTELKDLEGVFYKSLGVKEKDLDKDAKKSLSDFVSKMSKDFVTSYEVKDVSIDDDEVATVEVDVTYGYDPSAIGDINIEKSISKITEDYMTKNKDALTQLYLDSNALTVQKKVVNDILPDVLKAYTTAIEKTGEKSDDLLLKMRKKGEDSWQIVGAYTSAEKTDADSNADKEVSEEKEDE